MLDKTDSYHSAFVKNKKDKIDMRDKIEQKITFIRQNTWRCLSDRKEKQLKNEENGGGYATWL